MDPPEAPPSVSSQPLPSAADGSSENLNFDNPSLASASTVTFTKETTDSSNSAQATREQLHSSEVVEPMQPTSMPSKPFNSTLHAFANKTSPSALDANKLSAAAVNDSVSPAQTGSTSFVAPELSSNHASSCLTESLPSATTDLNLSISPESSGRAAAMILSTASPEVATESTLVTELEPAVAVELGHPNIRDLISPTAVAESSVDVKEPIQVEEREHVPTARVPAEQDKEQSSSLINVRTSTLDSIEPEAISVKESMPSVSIGSLVPVMNASSMETYSHSLPSALASLSSQLLVQPKVFPRAVGDIMPAVRIETLPLKDEHYGVVSHSMSPANVTSDIMPALGFETSPLNDQGHAVISHSIPPANVTSVDGESVLVVEGFAIQSGKMEDANMNKEGCISSGPREALIGRKVRKKFGKKHYFGEVIAFDPESKWYKVKYEDEDEEELEWGEVESILVPLNGDVQDVKSVSDTFRGDMPRSSDSCEEKRLRKRTTKHKVSSVRADDQAASFSEEKFDPEKVKNTGTLVIVGLAADGGTSLFNEDSRPRESAEPSLEVVRTKQASSGRKKRDRRNRKRRRSPSSTKKKLNEQHSQESQTRSERRVMTRSSTGSIGAHGSTSGVTPPPQSREDDGEEKKKQEDVVSRLSPLGGGFRIVGKKTRKDFGGQSFTGEVVSYDPRVKYYKVRYEDGDEEELEWSELKGTLLNQEEQLLSPIERPVEAAASVKKFPSRRLKDFSRRIRTPKERQTALVSYDERTTNVDVSRRRKKIKTASVSVMMKGNEDVATAPATPQMISPRIPPRPLVAARFACAGDADSLEYFGWGEVVNHEKTKCPELRAVRLLPTSSPIVHLAASHHHLAAITAAGQVWVWRNKHGNIHTRCNEWEHISTLEEKGIILVDIAGPDVDRTSAGYEPEQEDQVPDPFYLVAVCSMGEEIVLQGSQPHERVRTYQLDDEPRYPALKDAFLQSYPDCPDDVGRVVQVSVGMVEASDESPFVGYITDTDHVYIRSATRDFMEEVNLVAGYTGRPIKIECGSVYHAILMTDDGRAWTWGRGYYPGSSSMSSGFSNKWSFSVCQPAVGTLVGRKVVDVGCYGEDFIALTNDGDVHQWTHGVPNPVAGVYNVPATPIYGQGPCIPSGDKLKQVTIGAGMCAGITESGRVHTWRTTMKGVVAVASSEREILTPLGRDEGQKDTAITSLGVRVATKVMCMAGSLIVIVKRKSKSRRGGKRKLDLSTSHKMNKE